jgi:hypothetical protein
VSVGPMDGLSDRCRKNKPFAIIIATPMRLVKTQDTKETSQHFRHTHATDIFKSRRILSYKRAMPMSLRSADFKNLSFKIVPSGTSHKNSVKLTIHKINFLASQISV